jgi:hypothetical protein
MYAVTSEHGTLLTLFYDSNREKQGGMTFWADETNRKNVKRVILDGSMAYYRSTDLSFWMAGMEALEEIENMYFDGKEYVTYTKDKIFSDIYDASVECMEFLPDKLRLVMKERYIDQKKVAQIAIDNNIAQSSVKNWIRKGISCLSEEIRARHPELCELYEDSMTEQ